MLAEVEEPATLDMPRISSTSVASGLDQVVFDYSRLFERVEFLLKTESGYLKCLLRFSAVCWHEYELYRFWSIHFCGMAAFH